MQGTISLLRVQLTKSWKMLLVAVILVGRGKYDRHTTRKKERMTDDSLKIEWLSSPLTQNTGAHILPFVFGLSNGNISHSYRKRYRI